MIKRIRKRWSIVPAWLKALPIAALLIILSLLRTESPGEVDLLAVGVGRLFFIPLFMSSLLFGLKGGLICAAVISLNYVPSLFGTEKLDTSFCINVSTEAGLYFITGALTGLLVDRERREGKRMKDAENLALLGKAAAAVAHELKTPLVAIGGFALQLQRDLPATHPHNKKLGIIADQVAHMEKLLREMLDYSRPLELALKPHTLNELVDEVVSLCRPLASEAGVNLETRSHDGQIPAELDGPRIKQVVMNLVQNAVQASKEGTTVTVTTENQNNRARITVSDQGGGIPKQRRDKVFSPFFTTKTGGTGLGLPVSLNIVHAHGGNLELDEKYEGGASFVVTLPIARAAKQG